MKLFRSFLLIVPLFFTSSAMGQPLPVVVAPVVAEGLSGELHLTANVEAIDDSDISAEQAGLVAQVLVEEGDEVIRGQALLQLREGPARWRLQEAKASLKSAKAQLKLRQLEQGRLEKLLKSNSISQGLVDEAIALTHQAEADVDAKNATVSLMQDSLDNHTIKAPFDGLITTRLAEPGQWLEVGSAVFHLISHNRLKIELAIPQKYYPRISEATEISVNSEFSENSTTVKLGRIVAYADRSRNFQLWATLDNAEGVWLPGMAVTATLSWPGSSQFPWQIPADGLIRKADGSALVWRVIQDGELYRAEAVSVTAGPQVRNVISVSSDQLSSGDLVVIKGNEILQPRQQVLLTETEQ